MLFLGRSATMSCAPTALQQVVPMPNRNLRSKAQDNWLAGWISDQPDGEPANWLAPNCVFLYLFAPPQPICRFGKANLQKRTQSADSKPICRLGEANLQKRTQSADSNRICRLTAVNLQIRNQSADRNIVPCWSGGQPLC